MTDQIAEQLIFRGERIPMFSHPLESGPQSGPITDRLMPTSSANWRRYVGSWAIHADRLYLLGVDAHWLSGERVTLEQLFPESQWPLFASWFSGDLVIPDGNMLEYAHAGYGGVYQGRRILSFEDGCLIRERKEKTPRSFLKKLWVSRDV